MTTKPIKNPEALDIILRYQADLSDSIRRIEEKLSHSEDVFRFFSNGLKSYKDKGLQESKESALKLLINSTAERARNDKKLRYPHHKILDCLLNHHDYFNNEFKEVHFSKLVKESRIGKNMAKDYLSLLERKGYIEKRNDGYRVHFRIKRLPRE